MQFYSDPKRENDPHALPDCEVFRLADGEMQDEDGNSYQAGWYYWFCLPGCLPDSCPIGPFKSERAAIRDARGEI